LREQSFEDERYLAVPPAITTRVMRQRPASHRQRP
jgi:hypothetical protein